MKLAACYTIFNGIELLEKSMQSIADHVDIFVLCYQNISNRGNYDDVLSKISHFPGQKILFTPDLSVNTKVNERKKHELMANEAHRLGATHFIMMACDHFYDKNEFFEGKKIAEKYDATFTAMYTYFKNPEWQLSPIEDYYMPFICKLPATFQTSTNYPYRVDPSVRVKAKNYKMLDIMMHHYSMVRVDIRNKFSNSAAGYRWTNEQLNTFIDEYENYDITQNKGVTYFKGRKIKVVPNYFNL